MSKAYLSIRLSSQIILRAAACFVALFIFTAAASAATYTVDTTSDSAALTACSPAANDCSLRGAVSNANLPTASNDTIEFAIPAADPNCPGGVCTITLGDHLIVSIQGALTITNATGAGNLLISGNMIVRVFFVFGRSNLTLNGLTVTKGDATGTFATSENGRGGAINNFGTLTLTNCIVSGSTASRTGGGIYTTGTATLTNTTVTGNIASLNGGGIDNDARPLTLTGSTVSGNTSRSSGGGIYTTGTTTLTNTTVTGNIASLDGGGIYTTTTTATLTGSSFSGNTASRSGGGIYSGNTLNLTNSPVSGNATQFRGGGIYNVGAATLTNSTIDGNSTREAGGGLYNSGTATLTGSTISANRASGSSSSQLGGGIYNTGTATLTNSTVSGNIASQVAGGIWNNPGGTLNLTSVTVTLNQSLFTTACTCPGGITNQGTANLNNTIVAGNTVVNASNPPDFNGGISAASSYNLIGIGTNTTGITNGAGGNQIGTAANPINPNLNPNLALNGGATRSHALLTGSPAIDKGFAFGLTTDQRGFLRPVDNPNIANAAGGDGADIGAFEVQLAPTAASVSLSGRVIAGSRYVFNAVVHLTGPSGVLLTTRTNSFGYYRFRDIPSGATYIVDVSSKSYRFDPQVVNLMDDLDALDFSAR